MPQIMKDRVMQTFVHGLPFKDIDADPSNSREVMSNLVPSKILAVSLTDELVQVAVCASKESWVYDEGFPGLLLRLRPAGGKSYYYLRSAREDGGSGRDFVGDASDFTISQAREKARWIADGNYLAEPTRQFPLKLTLRKASAKYFQEHSLDESGWFKTVEQRFDRDILPKLGARALVSIRKRDWLTQIETVTLDAPRRGVALLRALKSFLNWAVSRNLLEANPLSRHKIELPDFPAPEAPPRLSIRNLADIYEKAVQLGEPWSSMVRLMILTGVPMETVRHLRGSDVDWDKHFWVLERHGGFDGPDTVVSVCLSAEAMTLLEPYRDRTGYFFASPKTRSTNGFNIGPAAPINFYTEVLDRLRRLTYVQWRWGVRDIARGVGSAIEESGDAKVAVRLWATRLAKALELDVTL